MFFFRRCWTGLGSYAQNLCTCFATRRYLICLQCLDFIVYSIQLILFRAFSVVSVLSCYSKLLLNRLAQWKLLSFSACVVEIFLIENQQSATESRRGPCLFVDSKGDGALIKVTGCNDSDERQSWAYTLKGQVMVGFGCLICRLEEEGLQHLSEWTTRAYFSL